MSFDRGWKALWVVCWILAGCDSSTAREDPGERDDAVTADEDTPSEDDAAEAMAGAPAEPSPLDSVRTVQVGDWKLEQYVNDRGETIECADLLAHGEQRAGDDTPFSVPAGESYNCFHFTSPWKDEVQGISTETVVDNPGLLHHWLLYDLRSPFNDGTYGPCLGAHPDGVLLTGWAPGDSAPLYSYEDDIGLAIPYGDEGRFLIELHYLNVEDEARDDRSGVRICATRDLRKYTAGIAWLGTENIGGVTGIPPGQRMTVSGTCTPSRAGLGPEDPIEIIGVFPHMHGLGRHIEILVHRADGKTDTYLDEPFDVDNQVASLNMTSILPGDTLETRCTYENDTDRAVPWGPSATEHEMCYAFVVHYPAGSLVNSLPSLAGAINTCFW